jgi:hypothetical protein
MSGLLATLEAATLEELRAKWGRRYGAPLRLRSPDLLRRILAWRIQAATEGGLDRTTRRLLRSDIWVGETHVNPPFPGFWPYLRRRTPYRKNVKTG